MSCPQSLKARAIRKELLVAESDVLRHQMGHDMAIIQDGMAALGEHAKKAASYASIGATVLAGVSEFRKARQAGPNGKAGFFATVLAGARTATAVWEAIKSRPK